MKGEFSELFHWAQEILCSAVVSPTLVVQRLRNQQKQKKTDNFLEQNR